MSKKISNFVLSMLLTLSVADAKFFLRQLEDSLPLSVKSYSPKKDPVKSLSTNKKSISANIKKVTPRKNSKLLLRNRNIGQIKSINKIRLRNRKVTKNNIKQTLIDSNKDLEKNKRLSRSKRNLSRLRVKSGIKKNVINRNFEHDSAKKEIYNHSAEKNSTSISNKNQKKSLLNFNVSYKNEDTTKISSKGVQESPLKNLSVKSPRFADKPNISNVDLTRKSQNPILKKEDAQKPLLQNLSDKPQIVTDKPDIFNVDLTKNPQTPVLKKDTKESKVLDKSVHQLPKNTHNLTPLHPYDFTAEISNFLHGRLDPSQRQNIIEHLKDLKLKIYITSPKNNNCMFYSFINDDQELLGQVLGNQAQAQQILSQGHSADFIPVRYKIYEDIFNNLDKTCYSNFDNTSIHNAIHKIIFQNLSYPEQLKRGSDTFASLLKVINKDIDLFIPKKISLCTKTEAIESIKAIFTKEEFLNNYQNETNKKRKDSLLTIINDNIVLEKIYWLLMAQEHLNTDLAQKLNNFTKNFYNSQFLKIQGKLSEKINYIPILNSADFGKIPNEDFRNSLKNSSALKEYFALDLQENQNTLLHLAQGSIASPITLLDILAALYDRTIYDFSYENNSPLNKKLVLDKILLGKNRNPIYIHSDNVHASKVLKVN